MIRTHDAGTLTKADIGKTVTLAGWVNARRDHGGVVFIDLRDATGIAQLVFREDLVEKLGAHKLRNEFCIEATGEVQLRDEETINPKMPTGEIEIGVATLKVLSTSDPLPFPIDERVNVGEDARFRYRYLDLRRPKPAAAIRMRSKVNQAARRVLEQHDFVEIETPTLTRSTPEGARDFLVPARLVPGSWYALPQSPQLFKQLLMVAGMERYYQIARCYRDEDFRADRQPEFTQLDIEMSFVNQEDVMALAEQLVSEIWQLIDYNIPTPLPRISFEDAMNKYGSDKPDLRYDLPLVDLTEFFANTPFRVFQNPYVGAIVMPGGASQPRRTFDAWQDWARQRGAKGLAYVTIDGEGNLGGPVAKNISEEERNGLAEATSAKPGDCIFFAAGEKTASQMLLGAARQEIAKRCDLIDDNQWSFCWVVDAPLFKPASEAKAEGDVAVGEGAWTAVHHAFTSPKPEYLDNFEEDPANALSDAYDIVCNGNEIGGGSIRIHRKDIQERVFKVMGIGEEEAQAKFGFLLDAFSYGAPPHGGIAFGWDRIVSLLTHSESIREVIAFPKTGNGFDPLTGAPAPITKLQRRETGVDFKPKKDDKKEKAEEAK
ncbi:aspartate--tRNA ligase [Propionimicrobium lymphophilum]|uniref:Aspartate--tRNA(Asp/Asn) ligase n=1 Tax=Propionimicrobium lymphophilum ACS-093-V-SCH5 TaxID=883161 RepID=S2W3A1_9ACTN|nr:MULTISPECIES: aspartate--tRNA ligase [Propionimicrobium]EPD32815.1 aspartyl-tRNA synthetase [Propionimicrobium lymphophilum ACS-093-V-SCH5]ETJ98264.1 aspartate--tRNA ligase [Propionimicrobium sp. BV2F7]MDK7710275.1 aspartate--tRNA ligase [Propionimicrobium lymphophilum]MDK7734290.1 aspartate--tRNA ligase [Propionimicrobium lymphophilum]